MDSTSRSFQFVGCGVEFDLAIDEGISTSHHLIQSKNYEIDCAGNSSFHNWKDGGKNAQATENRHQQITGQAHQGEGKRKGVTIHRKIAPLGAFVN